MTQGQYTQINFTSKQNYFENEKNVKPLQEYKQQI